MTLGMAWIGRRPDGRRDLYFASDSRTRGSLVFDRSPKILTLPRGDCAVCFAGMVETDYPLMLQLSYAIQAHQPALERRLDITRIVLHLTRVFSDIVARISDAAERPTKHDLMFLFGGYSWRKRDFLIWQIHYEPKPSRFVARPCTGLGNGLGEGKTVAFIGDVAADARRRLIAQLRAAPDKSGPQDLAWEPFAVLCDMLNAAGPNDTIGGAPQLVQITEYMQTRPLAVRWGEGTTLFGRELFDYENTDNPIFDPATQRVLPSRKFGRRE